MSDARPILAVEGLRKTFQSGRAFGTRANMVAVDDVSFAIARGETFGLIGESGSGKSTIGRLVLRLIEADAGSIRFDGTNIARMTERDLKALRKRIQIIFQDPFGSLDPKVRVGDAIGEPIRLHRLRDGAAVRARIVELLELVGLSGEHADRYPHSFSGGQRQRIAIARALAVEPELIVCDEPVSALDVSVQAQIVNLLADLRERVGIAYLFISHDLAVVRHLVDRVGVLYAGRLVEVGPSAAIFERPAHPYTRALLAASPRGYGHDAAARTPLTGESPDPYHLPVGCRFASRCPDATEPCRTSQPELAAVDDAGHQAACVRLGQTSPAASWPAYPESETYARRLALWQAALQRSPRQPIE